MSAQAGGTGEMMTHVIRVEPVTLDWAKALALGNAEFERRFGNRVEPGWDAFPETVPLLLKFAEEDRPTRFGPHLVFDRDGALVGTGGWKGEPVDGLAELGYAVAPSRRNRGIATALVTHLLATGRQAGVLIAVAHTRAEESASTHVLRKCGFQLRETLIDPDDGPIWRWERRLASDDQVSTLC